MWRVVWIRPYLCQVFAQAVSLVVSLIYRRPVLELWCCVSKVQYAVLSPMENGTHFKICVLWSWCIFLYGSQEYIILFYLCVFKRRLRISAIYLSTFCVTQPQAKAYFHCCTGAGVGWGGLGRVSGCRARNSFIQPAVLEAVKGQLCIQTENQHGDFYTVDRLFIFGICVCVLSCKPAGRRLSGSQLLYGSRGRRWAASGLPSAPSEK